MNEINNKIENEEDIFFDYQGPDGKLRKAEVLTLFRVDGYQKEYALCSIPTDDENFEITAFIVNSQEDGFSFDDIEDKQEFEDVSNVVKTFIRG